MKRSVIALGLAGALVLASTLGVVARPGPSDTFWLDSRDPASVPDASGNFDFTCQTSVCPTAEGTLVLKANRKYHVTVHGSISTWWPGWTDILDQGVPDLKPVHPSPGVPNGPVGLDASYIFAWPVGFTGWAGYKAPKPWRVVTFSVDGQETWFRTELKPEGYNDQHKYTYKITGGGHPLAARVNDVSHDNYGQFRITVKTAK